MTSAFSCPACGKQYSLKADLAGRKVKCKCGQVIAVPFQPESDDESGIFALAPDPEESKSKAARQTVMPSADQSTEPACPSCEAPLEVGSVICTQCGFNLKTGAQTKGFKAPVSASAQSKSGAPNFANIPRGLSPKKVGPAETRGDVLKKFGILLGILVVVAGALVAMKFVGRDPDAGKPALDDDDPIVTAAMKSDFPKEAREWLRTDSTWLMGGWNSRQAEAKVDDWYRMGAKSVTCFGTRMALWVAIELPDEPEKRKELFEWQQKWHSEMFERVRTDKGQKYMVIKLRL